MIFDDTNFPDLPETWTRISFGLGCRNKSIKSKVQAKTYLHAGPLPVVDQGSGLIGGYTEDPSNQVDVELPVVIFGDHTRAIRYVDFPFAAGADGIKILEPEKIYEPRAFFRFIQAIKLPEKGYARHFQHLRASEIPLPPLNEQRRIAAKLDTTLAAVDACRQRLDGVEALLKRFRQAVLAAATSGELTREWREDNPDEVDASSLAAFLASIHSLAGGHKQGNAAPPTNGVHDLDEKQFPEGWSLVDLRDIVRPDKPITYGILKPGPEIVAGIPYIRVADYPGDRLCVDGIRKTSFEIDEAYKRSRLEVGDLLLSIRGTVGRLVTIPPELEGANITQDSARLSIQEVLSASYIKYSLHSELLQSRMQRAVKGVAVRGINIGDVRALQVPLPSIQEQEEISRQVESLLSLADQLEARLTSARRIVERLTPALLAKAFRGELVPQDPNDEPASELLARIRAARQAEAAASGPSRRGRRQAAANPVPSPAEAAPVTPDRLANLLRECGALSERALLAASELDPASFQAQLAHERHLGAIGHVVDDGQELLEAVG
jgi:type I restriction enzyme S subunit